MPFDSEYGSIFFRGTVSNLDVKPTEKDPQTEVEFLEVTEIMADIRKFH